MISTSRAEAGIFGAAIYGRERVFRPGAARCGVNLRPRGWTTRSRCYAQKSRSGIPIDQYELWTDWWTHDDARAESYCRAERRALWKLYAHIQFLQILECCSGLFALEAKVPWAHVCVRGLVVIMKLLGSNILLCEIEGYDARSKIH